MAKKWQRMASLGRRRITMARRDVSPDVDACSTSVADKGHFVVYTVDGERFMVPLMYLNSRIFEELLKMSEEEFGLPSDGPIMLPCDAVSMKYILSLLRGQVEKEVEKALLHSLMIPRSDTCSSHPVGLIKPQEICSF
ncbi:auxin-responsive protein SAUR36-like [Typha latifolia]|uniref:auxin-responsive protein SAUR36-like n=1 Tax=Typha latifolia TaxID=4733 RepID=UPI003C2F9888